MRAHSSMVVVAFLVAGSLCLANGMEPFAFPFATQTVWQAGEPVPVVVSYDVPQFGLLDELTELKDASDAEEDLNQQNEIAVEEPSSFVMRPASSFLAKRIRLSALSRGPGEAVDDVEGMISKANAANSGIADGSEPNGIDLDAAMAAAAKEATDKLTSMALKFDEAMHPPGTIFGFPPEEAKVYERLRTAVKTGSSQIGTSNSVGKEEQGLVLSQIDEVPKSECRPDYTNQCPDGWTKVATFCEAGHEYSGPCVSKQDLSSFCVEQKKAFATICKAKFQC